MTFNITNGKPYRKIYRGQRHFTFSPDGIKIVPRACIEVIDRCPTNMVDMLNYAIAKGYIQPVVFMPDEEYMWHDLKT